MGSVIVQITGSEAQERVYELCNSRGYFTCGSSRQYEKFLNCCAWGCGLEILARMLWLCCDESFSYENVYIDLYETLNRVEEVKCDGE